MSCALRVTPCAYGYGRPLSWVSWAEGDLQWQAYQNLYQKRSKTYPCTWQVVEVYPQIVLASEFKMSHNNISESPPSSCIERLNTRTFVRWCGMLKVEHHMVHVVHGKVARFPGPGYAVLHTLFQGFPTWLQSRNYPT